MKQQLTLHIRAIHEKVRPYTCDLCSFAAARKQEVVRHRTAVHDPSKVIQNPKLQNFHFIIIKTEKVIFKWLLFNFCSILYAITVHTKVHVDILLPNILENLMIEIIRHQQKRSAED